MISPEHAYDVVLLALCIWREARGEPIDAKRGVAWVVRNRVEHPSWWGKDWNSVILKPWQFSSFNSTDANAVKWPSPLDTAWQASLEAAREVFAGDGADPTGGATHYHDDSLDAEPPAWARDGSLTPTVRLGRLRFFRPSVRRN